MANKFKNKVIYNGPVLIDLTADTVTADKILATYTAHDKAGNIITGTCDYDVNSKDATVGVAEILKGKTAYAAGKKLTGTMPNNGAVTLTIDTVDGVVKVPQAIMMGPVLLAFFPPNRLSLLPRTSSRALVFLVLRVRLNLLAQLRSPLKPSPRRPLSRPLPLVKDLTICPRLPLKRFLMQKLTILRAALP